MKATLLILMLFVGVSSFADTVIDPNLVDRGVYYEEEDGFAVIPVQGMMACTGNERSGTSCYCNRYVISRKEIAGGRPFRTRGGEILYTRPGWTVHPSINNVYCSKD